MTIARWVAGGVQTMLCFDPTRGIDIGTKSQIYVLLRDLAAAGAAVLLYTSELKEVQLACDRAIVIFGGRVVAEIDVADADEPALLRAAYNLRSDAVLPEAVAAEVVAEEACNRSRPGAGRNSRRAERRRRPMSAATGTVYDSGRGPGEALVAWARRNGWVLSLLALLGVLFVFTKFVNPNYGVTGFQGFAISVLPLAFAAVAQAICVISGGSTSRSAR